MQTATLPPASRPALWACVFGLLLSTGCTNAVRPSTGSSGDVAIDPAILTWERWSCEGRTLEVAFADDRAHLRNAAGLTTLTQERSASGTRFAGKWDARTIGLWSKGPSLSYSPDGTHWVECSKPESSTFSAWGQEPSWRLRLDGNHGELLRPGMGEPLALQVLSLRSEGATTMLSADSTEGAVDIRLGDGICRDVMSGMPFPQSVSIDLPNRQLQGCGGEPARLLHVQPWAIRTPVPGREIATLTFGDMDELSLQGPCNRHLGHYQLSGEGLTLSFGAATLMACSSEAEQEEQRLLDAIIATTRFDVDDHGQLNLIGPRGLLVQAQPAPLM